MSRAKEVGLTCNVIAEKIEEEYSEKDKFYVINGTL